MAKVWSCKIGEVGNLEDGADEPMRRTIREAYVQLTGVEPDFIFSGWGAELDSIERECVEEWNAKRS